MSSRDKRIMNLVIPNEKVAWSQGKTFGFKLKISLGRANGKRPIWRLEIRIKFQMFFFQRWRFEIRDEFGSESFIWTWNQARWRELGQDTKRWVCINKKIFFPFASKKPKEIQPPSIDIDSVCSIGAEKQIVAELTFIHFLPIRHPRCGYVRGGFASHTHHIQHVCLHFNFGYSTVHSAPNSVHTSLLYIFQSRYFCFYCDVSVLFIRFSCSHSFVLYFSCQKIKFGDRSIVCCFAIDAVAAVCCCQQSKTCSQRNAPFNDKICSTSTYESERAYVKEFRSTLYYASFARATHTRSAYMWYQLQ